MLVALFVGGLGKIVDPEHDRLVARLIQPETSATTEAATRFDLDGCVAGAAVRVFCAVRSFGHDAIARAIEDITFVANADAINASGVRGAKDIQTAVIRQAEAADIDCSVRANAVAVNAFLGRQASDAITGVFDALTVNFVIPFWANAITRTITDLIIATLAFAFIFDTLFAVV